MNPKQPKTQMLTGVLRRMAEQSAPGEKIDLWPALQSRLLTSAPQSTRGSNMNSRLTPITGLRLAAFITLAVVMTSLLLLATPQGQAWAQSVLHFFNRSQTDTMPGPTEAPLVWVEQTQGTASVNPTPWPTASGPAFETQCGGYDRPTCSIKEIQALVKFPVFALSEIPEGLFFTGATGGPERVHLVYSASDQTGWLMIDEEPWTGSPQQSGWEVGASANIETITVDSITAEYVKGAYFSDGSRDPAQWDPDADLQVLRWVDQGVLFNLMKSGPTPPLERDGLAALIRSMTSDPDQVLGAAAQLPTIAPTEHPGDVLRERFSLSVQQAETEAGFTIHLPTHLPEVLTLMGARYEPDYHWVTVFYAFNHEPETTDGLSLSEQPVPESGDCGLCGFAIETGSDLDTTIPGKLISQDAALETVTIGSISGQYVEGVWVGTDQGWRWEPTPYMKTLRWQANGTAYELAYMGMYITKEDLLAIAEAIQ